MKKSLQNIVDGFALLKAAEVKEKYITPAGDGFIDGLTSAGIDVPDMILRSEYDKLLDENKKLKEEMESLRERKNIALLRIKELQNKKRWF